MVLVIVTESEGNRQVWFQPEVVLHEPTHHLLKKHQAPFALLAYKREWLLPQVIGEAGKIECAGKVGAIVGASPTKVGGVHARLDEMPAVRPGKNVVELRVIFCG